MKPQVKILETVIKRLKGLNEPCSGKLYGIQAKNTLTILGLQLETDPEHIPNYSLPAEIDFCGIFEAYSDTFDTQQVLTKCSNVEVTDNPIFISVKLTIQNDINGHLVYNNQITKTSYTVHTTPEIYTQFVHVRLRGQFQVNAEPNQQSINDNFLKLRQNITSGVMAYVITKLNVILITSDSESGIIGLTGDPTFGEICQEANGEGSQKKKQKGHSLELEIVDVEIIKRSTQDSLSGETKGHSPVVVLDKKQQSLINIPVKIDFLATIFKETRLSKLYDILVETCIKQIRFFESVFQKYLSKEGNLEKSVVLPETLHFFPNECGHFLARIIFPDMDENLKTDRELLHNALLLSKTTPMFRKSNQFQFPEGSKSNNVPLINVHEGVKPTNNGGKVVLVKGNYEYYHYCQNKMDDNGWGCAYRSLQTLASWFKLQGYVEREVPTFKEIQKCLVDIGDKPSSFVDSRQWIGSTEVNYVLSSLLGVTSKILFVSSGEEMGSKGPELVNHFETQGTPVMIGGGVLAHTILGVDYNQQTGSLKFLILDPHYTGGEDLNVIQNKGWCGWKGVEFWDKTAYYNMCLPQVPREI